MGDPSTAHNNLAPPMNAQFEPINTNVRSEIGLQDRSTLQQRSTCISCNDSSDAVSFTAPCKHSYCDDCLASYVNCALEPGGVFPPVCCKLPITLQSARARLHPDLVKRYQEKHLEILTFSSLPCAWSGCCVLIPPERIVNGLGHCSACNNYTCALCRMKGHKEDPCPTDAEQRGVIDLAKEKGWQTCYRCRNMIELNFGCHHITCICKAEFCYVCGKVWRSCKCPQFHYDYHEGNPPGNREGNQPRYRLRTIFRAERAVERYNRFLRQTWGKPDPRSLEEQIQEVRAEVENGCDHGYWLEVGTTKEEPGHCKLCKYVGHKRIYQCRFCPLTSCWACHTDAPPEYRRENHQQT